MNGLVLGKFMPPHAGHLHLLRAACRHVGEERLTIVVDASAAHAIPGERRRDWLRELFPKARVVLLEGERPQQPADHPRFWEIWRDALQPYAPSGVTTVFAGEDYGAKLAEVLGARFVMVDRMRDAPPVSGTLIRSAPLRHWEYLPPCVRAYYVKRVAVFGPESTGKTVLAERLGRHFGTVHVPEFARGYIDAKGIPAAGPLCTYEDIEQIARGQLALEDRLAREAQKVLICDTDTLVTRIYSEKFFGRCPEWVTQTAQSRRYDLYLLTRDDTPFVADAQRDLKRWQSGFNRIFRRRLEEKGAPFVEIGGGWEERFQAARRAVEGLLEENPARTQGGG
jgi:HTH-type transcriptional regulator, transcriptional repressor of NAD biosynthesis genes